MAIFAAGLANEEGLSSGTAFGSLNQLPNDLEAAELTGEVSRAQFCEDLTSAVVLGRPASFKVPDHSLGGLLNPLFHPLHENSDLLCQTLSLFLCFELQKRRFGHFQPGNDLALTLDSLLELGYLDVLCLRFLKLPVQSLMQHLVSLWVLRRLFLWSNFPKLAFAMQVGFEVRSQDHLLAVLALELRELAFVEQVGFQLVSRVLLAELKRIVVWSQ